MSCPLPLTTEPHHFPDYASNTTVCQRNQLIIEEILLIQKCCDDIVVQFRETYEKIDLDRSYKALFELLWYSQLPCFDVLDVTTQLHEEFGY